MALKPKSLGPPKGLRTPRGLLGGAVEPVEHAPSRPRGILIGRQTDTKEWVALNREWLSTHMQVIGATGVGKSKFLEIIARQIILNKGRPSLIVLDPHGDLYTSLLAFCAAKGIRDRLVILDPHESTFITGFNPMGRDRRSIAYQSVMMLEAIKKCWGMATFQATPRMARWVYNTIRALVEAGLTLNEALYLLDPHDNQERPAILRNVKDPIVKRDWAWFESLGEKRKSLREERTESAHSRFRPFLQIPAVKYILTQQKTVVEFNKVLGEGKIVLVNLSPYGKMSQDDSALLGTLIINEILASAFQRPKGERRNCYLMIDEFQNFVTKDLCAILDGGRKFGLHLILAHQHLRQLKERDEEVYYSTLTNARTKVVFGGLDVDDAETMAKRLKRFNLMEVKQELYRTIFAPVETTREIITESEGEVTHEGVARAFASGAVYDPNVGWFEDPLLLSESEHEGNTESEGRSHSFARSRTEVPFYEYHERQELASQEFWSLADQLYNATMQFTDLPNRYFAIKCPNKDIVFCKTPTISEPKISTKRFTEFTHQLLEEGGFASRIPAIEAEQKERLKALFTRAKQPETIEEALDDTKF